MLSWALQIQECFSNWRMLKIFDTRQNMVMDRKHIFDRIEYVVACVGAFAQRFKLSNSQAYAYLRRFSGIDFLLECYAAEHTLSIDDAVSDLQLVCRQKGGRI